MALDTIFSFNIPIQMIFCTDCDGKITPIRFRFRDRNDVIAVRVEEILRRDINKTDFGTDFEVSGILYGEKRRFFIAYQYQMHTWRLKGISY